jgi:hypothetical protein
MISRDIPQMLNKFFEIYKEINMMQFSEKVMYLKAELDKYISAKLNKN